MSKVLLFSDSHIHMHKNRMSRLDDCLESLKWVFDTANNKNIKTIIFAGDLFQDRQKIHVISYEKTFRLIRERCEVDPDLRLFILVGNHDMWSSEKWDISSVAPLEAISNVKVINSPSAVSVCDDCIMDFLPYTKNPLEDIVNFFPVKNRILISHIAISGAQLNSRCNTKAEISVEFEGDMVEVDAKNFEGWERVFLGHYHSAQKLNDIVEYIGSPLELNFGEAFSQKHIIVLDTDTLETDYVINDFSPKHLVIGENDVDNFNLENNFVQVVVEDIASIDFIDFRKKLLTRGPATLEFKEKPRKKDTDPIISPNTVDLKSGEILKEWMKSHGIGDLNEDELYKIGQEIIRRAS